MAWVEKLPSGLYRARWRDAAGVARSKSPFIQAAEANRYGGEQEGLTRRGQAGYVGRTITWGRWCDAWLELRRVERTSESSDLTRINRWLRPQWGAQPLARISGEDIQQWVNVLDRQMSPASVEKVYRLFSSSMKAAVRYKRLSVSPCVDIQLPIVPPPDERFLTRAEVDSVLHFMSEPYRTAMVVLFGTGMRFGEMAGLHWSRVDLDGLAVDVHETWDGERVKAYPKGRRKRRVPLPSWVAEELVRFPQQRRGCGLPHADRKRCTSDLVLRGPNGAPLNARNMLRRHWGPAVARAGLEHARQHDARHSTASWLIQGGCTLPEVAAILGHSDATVTARYAHLAGTHMERVRGVLEGAAPYSPHSEVPVDLGEVATGQ